MIANPITGKPYRLLTEAEWEYAARAGAVTDDAGGSGAHRRRLCRKPLGKFGDLRD